ncbi:MAG: VWA domain-containing protein [Bryobacteraceae bacterium]
MRTRLIALFSLALPLSLTLAAQQQKPPDPPSQAEADATFKLDVDLVNILFSVRSKQGRLIPDLTKDDFTVLEETKSQPIKYFARETNLPLTLGLLVDVSGSQANLIDIEKRAASAFFGNVLKEKDEAFLISFGTDTELLQDFTNSPKLLRAGLDGLRVQGGISGGLINPGPIPTKPRGTVMFEAVYLAANEKMRSEVGRKAIVLITDGQDQGSRTRIGEAIEAAQKADSIIYSIQYIDRHFYGFGGGGDGDLKRMSEETGGRLFRVDGKHTLEEIFREIQEEMRSQYAIGYSPTNPAKDGTFRKLEIHTKDKELRVQARKGYYAVTESR